MSIYKIVQTSATGEQVNVAEAETHGEAVKKAVKMCLEDARRYEKQNGTYKDEDDFQESVYDQLGRLDFLETDKNVYRITDFD